MDYLPKEDYLDIGLDLGAGEQVSVDHSNCTAGTDYRSRLFIKRTEDGNRIVAYCHNCGLGGSYGDRDSRALVDKKKRTDSRTSLGYVDIRLPKDFERTVGEWPTEARVWLSKYGIRDSEILDNSIGYSNSLRRVVLPIYRESELIGYQSRKIFRDDDKPKYVTMRKDSEAVFWYSGNLLLSRSLVITEDILSAVKCSRYLPSLALLTAYPKDAVIEFIAAQRFKEFIVFLDNDNRQVKKSQIALKNRLSSLGKCVIIHADRDPKEHSDEELERLLL